MDGSVSHYTVFEYGAILKGSQTLILLLNLTRLFEYGAILKDKKIWIDILDLKELTDCR